MPTRRQTQSFLRSLFAQRGIMPHHRLGQNFLIDLNIHELIVRTADLSSRDVVLEIGPGAGALTALIADRASAVVAVEIDPAMAKLTAETVADRPNVRVLHADALASKHKLNPEMLDNIEAGLAVAPDRRFKLVANLPYNVATPVVSNLLVHPSLCPTSMVVTIQLELAERMRAQPEAEAYGALSIVVQALTEIELVRVLPPGVFWPRPKVDSAVVKITPNPAKRALIQDLPWFHSVVRQIFLHRRKNLRRVLYSYWRDRWTKPEVDALLEGLGLTGLVRAEALSADEFIDLAHALKLRLGDGIEAPAPEGERADQPRLQE
jgi:16S rRNA (adenine1518-N6/adenine1519-N6)-dimethyltransferase